MTGSTARFALSLALIGVVIAVGALTRARYVGTASAFDAALPGFVGSIPAAHHCGSAWIDSVYDETAGAAPVRKGGVVQLPAGHVLDISGWAYIQGRQDLPRAMIWAWDNGAQQVAMYPLKREDVAAKSNDRHALFSGFFIALDTSAHHAGTHPLDFLLLDHDARSGCWFESPITLVLQ